MAKVDPRETKGSKDPAEIVEEPDKLDSCTAQVAEAERVDEDVTKGSFLEDDKKSGQPDTTPFHSGRRSSSTTHAQ